MKNTLSYITFFLICTGTFLQAQTSNFNAENLKGLEFRSIGPAFMSGRIADIAIDPNDESVWYVAVGSGNVWKTVNAGVTWKPIFEDQSVYSTGCITIDPNNSSTIWLGTGENVGGRHVSWGDGIYKSTDSGETWDNMGLKQSQHIAEILIHPENSNIIWVASQGPLWSSGGERGVYKSIDGGATWKQTLGDAVWTGATEIIMDPRNPDVLYCATWDRHRTVAAYMGGGPGSGIHKSTDGGETWTKLSKGLPESNLGKTGLCLSPQKPDVIYAAVELDLRKGGLFKSMDGGMTWAKQSDAITGGTGPHYYQELYACPHNYDRLYLMDNNAQISDDGGKTFRRMNEKNKHGDNHSINFKMSDPDYLLLGSDGGIYETFDLCKNWRYIENLPITQFYDIAIDDAEPFYNVYGGTQDNSTEGGPSRTDNIQGIQNSDWKVVLNWDGHQPATEPGNPNIVYAQRQQGTLSRLDMATGEAMDIQPQAGADDPHERFNWDAPILVSPHDPKQLFFGSQRLWRSNNRGDSWTAISTDLSRNENRFTLPIMGRQQSINNPWDVYAMSNYNTISMVDESPVQRDLIYVGTDDGLIQITEDGGATWNKTEASRLSGVPQRAYINDIKADLFDANVAYMAMDNHKEGDFRPFLFKTSDKGKSWKSITANLPKNNIIWRIVQDHVDKNLIFIGTEFGIYATRDGGGSWTQLKGGLPTISFRDLKIHRRENDLVAASFGRSIYILDDFSSLRNMNDQVLNKEASLFPVRDAWWYIERSHLGFNKGAGSQGSQHYIAENPPFGALLSYYIKDDIKSQKDQRAEAEKKLEKQNIPFPGWENLDKEANAIGTEILLVIRNNQNEVIRQIKGETKKGIHRTSWDLRYPATSLVSSAKPNENAKGFLVAPGKYSVELIKIANGETTVLSEKQEFNVKQMKTSTLKGASIQEVSSFWKKFDSTGKEASAIFAELDQLKPKLKMLRTAVGQTPSDTQELNSDINVLSTDISTLLADVHGSPSKQKPGEKTHPLISERMFSIALGLNNSTYGPTETNKASMNIVQDQLGAASSKLKMIKKEISRIATRIVEMGGPYIKGEY